jgi:hypothetical protein
MVRVPYYDSVSSDEAAIFQARVGQGTREPSVRYVLVFSVVEYLSSTRYVAVVMDVSSFVTCVKLLSSHFPYSMPATFVVQSTKPCLRVCDPSSRERKISKK